MTDTFAGYNHNLKINAGEFFNTMNLTAQYYPLMANRKKRGYVKDLFDPGGLMDKVHLAYIDEGTLYINDRPTGLKNMMPGQKQMVGMGAYICIFPDAVYYNTADPSDYGSMDTIIDQDAQQKLKYVVGAEPKDGNHPPHFMEKPEQTEDTYYTFIGILPDTSAGGTLAMARETADKFQEGETIILPYQYTDYDTKGGETDWNPEWLKRNKATIVKKIVHSTDTYQTPVTYEHVQPNGTGGSEVNKETYTGSRTRVQYDGSGQATTYICPYDFTPTRVIYVYVNGVMQASGWSYDPTYKWVRFVNAPPAGKNNIEITWEHSGAIGALNALLVAVPKNTDGDVLYENTLRTSNVPSMDYVVECQNRLWGCKYGIVKNQNINEIYCCALGDFKNWNRYEGTSMDPYTASIGSDGPWTGAINYQGYPTFFKEDRIHRVSVSPIGAHEITETVCDGVQEGSSGSLAIIAGLLYYKTPSAVCIYQGGSAPVVISEALGDMHYKDAVAAANGDRLFICMTDQYGARSLFTYDTKRGLWMREDELDVVQFAAVGEELYALTAGKGIWALNGTKGQPEEHVYWCGETGILYYQYPDKKYVSRFNFRIQMEQGTRFRVFIEYDSSGLWERCGEIIASGTKTVTLPIKPRRCDHMRIRIEGRGNCKIFSIAKILEIGSDY